MDIDVHITTLNWDDATPVGYDEALERLVREFAAPDDQIDVGMFDAEGDLIVSFVSRLRGVSAYDGQMPPSIGLEFESGAIVALSRRGFRDAAWLEQPGPIREIERAVRFSIDDHQIEFTHP
jgi:hypothetical protein